jgi:hypothetical protein
MECYVTGCERRTEKSCDEPVVKLFLFFRLGWEFKREEKED